MSEKNLAYSSSTSFLGRNGEFVQSGMVVSMHDHGLLLQPVTSKHEIGRCALRIPMSDIPEFLLAINQLVLGIEDEDEIA